MPLYDYDHIIPWEKVREHKPDNLTLLCSLHHREKTNGLLSDIELVKSNNEPFNLHAQQSSPYSLHFKGKSFQSVIGSNVNTWPKVYEGLIAASLVIDDTPIVLFKVEEGHLLITIQLFSKSNELLLQIENNELIYSTSPWDIEFVGRKLTIRSAPRDIFIQISFNIPGSIQIDKGHIWRNGIELSLEPNRLLVVNDRNMIKDNHTQNESVGILIGNCPLGVYGGIRLEASRKQYINSRNENSGWRIGSIAKDT